MGTKNDFFFVELWIQPYTVVWNTVKSWHRVGRRKMQFANTITKTCSKQFRRQSFDSNLLLACYDWSEGSDQGKFASQPDGDLCKGL